MFYYYGRKKQIAKHYPFPNFKAIVEPFAGSAAYSLDLLRKSDRIVKQIEIQIIKNELQRS